jgi:hypothetical protein
MQTQARYFTDVAKGMVRDLDGQQVYTVNHVAGKIVPNLDGQEV